MGFFDFLDPVGDFFSSAASTVKDGVSDAFNWGKDAVSSVYNDGLKPVASDVYKGIKGGVNMIGNKLDKASDNLLDMQKLFSNPIMIGVALLAAIVIVPKILDKV